MNETDICENCKYGGEPNGCNRPEGECQAYVEALELIEKNRPAKMRQPVPGHFECPQCLDNLNPMWDYCPWCGQRVED